ncbi:hypothetical protein BDR26DRAFT_695500 [Obelidium mucronatum]|nr:hypothetical protein BDR26DRAFT_695500 [Obelidium mucronatum]
MIILMTPPFLSFLLKPLYHLKQLLPILYNLLQLLLQRPPFFRNPLILFSKSSLRFLMHRNPRLQLSLQPPYFSTQPSHLHLIPTNAFIQLSFSLLHESSLVFQTPSPPLFTFSKSAFRSFRVPRGGSFSRIFLGTPSLLDFTELPGLCFEFVFEECHFGGRDFGEAFKVADLLAVEVQFCRVLGAQFHYFYSWGLIYKQKKGFFLVFKNIWKEEREREKNKMKEPWLCYALVSIVPARAPSLELVSRNGHANQRFLFHADSAFQCVLLVGY